MLSKTTVALLATAVFAVPAFAAEDVPTLTLKQTVTLDEAAAAPKADGFKWFADPASKGLPLPFHTIEGYGGGAITPIAYLVNGGGKNTVFGMPSASVTYVNAGSKDLETFAVTETLFSRVELGYGAERFGLGGLRGALQKATGVDVGTEIWLHNFNARVAVLDEGAFGQEWIPAITIGAHYKYNADISRINSSLGGALSSIGYKRASGEDFTLTVSKMFPKVFGRPLIVSAGARESQAAQLGILGFSDQWNATFEGNIVYLPTDYLAVAYEFRGKVNPYNEIPGLIGDEDYWQGLDVSWLINKHATVVAGYCDLGNVANAEVHSGFWFQFKYEF